MSRLNSLVLLSAGSLGLFFCTIAARADSIPTLTATSVTYQNNYQSQNRWTISGDSFSLSGQGLASPDPGGATPGQSLANDDDLPDFFGATAGHGTANTYGTVTLGGVNHNVLLEKAPGFFFPQDSIYNPFITGTYVEGSGTYTSVQAFAPAIIVGNPYNNNQPIALQEDFCPFGESQPSCFGAVLANVYIDVPGIATLGGTRLPGQTSPSDYISSVTFIASPEPMSAGLAAMGLATILLFLLRRKKA